METREELETRIQKASFILKSIINRWNTLDPEIQNTTTYKMVEESLNMLEGRFNDYATLEVNIEDEVFLQIAKMAHERDITFNQMVEMTLREHAEKTIAEFSQCEENQEDTNSEEK